MSFYIKLFDREDGIGAWNCYGTCRENNWYSLINRVDVDDEGDLYICDECYVIVDPSRPNVEKKVVFYNGNRVVDSIFICMKKAEPLTHTERVKKYMPMLERSMERFFTLIERDKVLRMFKQMERRNKKSK